MPATNALLTILNGRQREALAPHIEPYELVVEDILHEKNRKILHVYFVTEGVVSMVNEPNPGEIVEVATIGNEGFVGIPVVLAARAMPTRSMVQIAGEAMRIRVEPFLALLDADHDFRALLLRYALALMNQIAQSTSCNRLHEVQERGARWLLQTHDRVSGDSFALTHEFLAQMLGCHRPTVSIALGMLQRAGLIDYSRGSIRIRDREGLEQASCSCYRTIRQEYEKLLER
jgi:CRP-like cAMP-binding protein